MAKGNKSNPSKDRDGNWFSHPGLPPIPLVRTPATSTGATLGQTGATERYPKICKSPERKSEKREYPFSAHDNRFALHRAVDIFDIGLGRRKVGNGQSLHGSHNFHLWAAGPAPRVSRAADGMTFYHTDFPSFPHSGGPSWRRFPRNHAQASNRAAAPAEGDPLWFGRHDDNQRVPLAVLAATQRPSAAKPWSYSFHNTYPCGK
ncbi:testis-expressed protein 36 [Amia ocellicauda]|uniref:testis-expressed protein 36 n=1 Tax=Amia ocellicauda TaxID=2972642 RepID=UPI003463EAB1